METRPTDLLALAAKANGLGQVDEAERLGLEVLKRQPENLKAHLLLGTLASQRNRLLTAVFHFEKAILLSPESPEPIRVLAALYLMLNRPSDAVRMCRLAVSRSPDQVEPQVALATCLMQSGNFEEAKAIIRKAVELRPLLPALHYRYALISQHLKDDETAFEEYRAGAALDQNGIRGLHATAVALASLANFEDAALVAEGALVLDPSFGPARKLLVNALWELERFQECRDQMELALQEMPEDSEIQLIEAHLRQEEGKFDLSREALHRSLKIQPNQGAAYYSLVQCDTITEPNSHELSKMLALASSGILPKAEDFQLRLAIGKAYEDLQEYESAMAQYDLGNRILAEMVNAKKPFSKADYSASVDALLALDASSLPHVGSPHANGSELPVLVIGMMRSGTTLVEQILASHPVIAGAGEQLFWTKAVHGCLDSGGGGLIWNHLRAAGNEYSALLRRYGPDSRRVIDKLPGNFMYAGIVHAAIPGARFIHVRRSPIDTCLSIWSTRLREPMNFSGEKSNIVFAYKEYLRLMRRWRERLPQDRFLEVDYELLVASPEVVIRKMLDFCDVPWSDDCLHPELRKSRVKTASLVRVRAGIDTTRVNRWRRFEPWLGEFGELLSLASE